MPADDTVFWERLSEMPFEEQEPECVLRREHVILRMAMLRGEKVDAEQRGAKDEAKLLGVAIFEDGAQLTLINERVNYLRRTMDSVNWRTAIRTVLGEDAYVQVLAYRIQYQQSLMPLPIPST